MDNASAIPALETRMNAKWNPAQTRIGRFYIIRMSWNREAEETGGMGIVFALILFGCSDDGSACQPLLAEPKHYISRALCEADEDAALQSEAAAQADFPTVATRCLQTGAVSIVARGAKDEIARLSVPTRRGSAPLRFGR